MQFFQAIVYIPNIQTVGFTLKFGNLYELPHQRISIQELQHHLSQLCIIKQQLYLQIQIDIDCGLENLIAVPVTCIQSLSLYRPSDKVCEWLKSLNHSNLFNLQELFVPELDNNRIESIFNLHELRSLTRMKLTHIQEIDVSALKNVPNLKSLGLSIVGNRMNFLQGLSQLCAKGTFQKLELTYEYFGTDFVDSICVYGCNLQSVELSVMDKPSQFGDIIQYMYKKWEDISSRVPYWYIKRKDKAVGNMTIFNILEYMRHRWFLICLTLQQFLTQYSIQCIYSIY
eukprot:TRINITY_DN1267_c1_g1_i1.p2 TRINITY_DN1267_c1_g1~~TRINITY_DN1267_c1_g1_i1.p2  ORF type:complete len:285 (-),score=2.04 TRINITY_DN1267_c1_g1_i1:219-1073(-)